MANSNKRNSYILIICGLILLSLGIFLSVSIGAKDIDFSTMVNSVFGNGNDINSKIIRDVRIPRALAGVLVGGFLAVSGAIMQGITRNPIAEPSVIGITQGATFMVAIALVLQQVNTNIVIGRFSLMIFAFIGASISGLFVYFISSRSIYFFRTSPNTSSMDLLNVFSNISELTPSTSLKPRYINSDILSFSLSSSIVSLSIHG